MSSNVRSLGQFLKPAIGSRPSALERQNWVTKRPPRVGRVMSSCMHHVSVNCCALDFQLLLTDEGRKRGEYAVLLSKIDQSWSISVQLFVEIGSASCRERAVRVDLGGH